MGERLRVLGGGDGQPLLLLLLHGLGATAEVWEGWRPLLAERWPGRWVAPDLPGHGGSAPLSRYSFGSLPAAVTLPGLGHNAHVEDPAAVLRLLVS